MLERTDMSIINEVGVFNYAGFLLATQLVDSTVPTTRSFWRGKLGYPQYADDPRPFAECLEKEGISWPRFPGRENDDE
jgi:hypothetical protein